MRIATFVPAILGLTLFAASTQAGPVSKRGQRNDIDVSIPKAIVKLTVDAVAEACAKLTLQACADVSVDLWADANVGGGLNILNAKVDVKDLKIRAKADVDAEVKALVKAEVEVDVKASVEAHVDKILLKLCPVLSADCVREHAHAITVEIKALIDVKIPEIKARIVAKVDAKVRARLNIVLREINANVVGLVKATIKGSVKVASDIHLHLDADIKVWAKVYLTVIARKIKAGLF